MRTLVLATVCCLLTAAVGSAGAQGRETGFLNRHVTIDSATFRYQVYVPPDYSIDRMWPVIVWLHQNGPQGTDGIRPTDIGLGQVIRNWVLIDGTAKQSQWFPGIVVFPQASPGHLWDHAMQVQTLAALDAVSNEFRVDSGRTYLVGWSMGGRGVWSLAARLPDRFAAIVVIAGPVAYMPESLTSLQRETALRENDFLRSADPFTALASKIRGLPTWVFQGAADQAAPPEEARRIWRALQEVNPGAKYTEYANVGHSPDRSLAEPDLWPWLFSQKKERK